MVSRTWRRILGAVPPARHLPRAVRAGRAAASVAAGASVAGQAGVMGEQTLSNCREIYLLWESLATLVSVSS